MQRIHQLIFLLLLTACGVDNTTTPGSAVNVKPFFALEAYFDREIARLDSIQPGLLKKATFDGKSEEKRVETTDFKQELQIFRRSDLNRPSWLDKYRVDSMVEAGILKKVSYTALDTTLYTRLLSVSYQDGAVDSIQVQNRAHSAIARTEQNLLYLPGRGYQIESKQKTIGADMREILIEVEMER